MAFSHIPIIPIHEKGYCWNSGRQEERRRIRRRRSSFFSLFKKLLVKTQFWHHIPHLFFFTLKVKEVVT
jgi:hypothetical protein